MPAEALGDVKKALEIAEYALNVTNGDNPADVVSLRDRHELIKAWLLAKQINQSPVKNFGLRYEAIMKLILFFKFLNY